jgi:predicted  nucleic acid-binding Zn-ribbon protein
MSDRFCDHPYCPEPLVRGDKEDLQWHKDNLCLGPRIQEDKEAITSLTAKIESLEGEHIQNMAYEQQVEDLQKRITQLHKGVRELGDSMTVLEKRNQELQEEREENSEEVNEYFSRAIDAEAKINRALKAVKDSIEDNGHQEGCTIHQHTISGYICNCGWDRISDELDEILELLKPHPNAGR